MRALKILVVVMGVLLVGGFVTLIYLLTQKSSQHHKPLQEGSVPEIVIQPTDAVLVDMKVEGGALYLRFHHKDGNAQIVRVDESGQKVIQVRFEGAEGN